MHSSATPGNRLAAETSPYLLQHANDPVDWHAWGPEALRTARELDRPVFLSIGYAACHWCHVMHRESFADVATAQILNEGFVSIKVDREERPDVDALYMDALQTMTGGGGWPMSVFLTPDGRPFHAGTYYPDLPRHGMPAFQQVLAAVGDAWRDRRGEVEAGAMRLADAVARAQRSVPVAPVVHGPPGADMTTTLDRATAVLVERFDAHIGAWGGAPLFPQPMVIDHLLRESVRTGNGRARATAQRALDAMAAGGIRDHLGGGFARYATDARWLVPHFEKMLFDNAQLALVYLHAWRATDDARYRDVVTETLDFLRRELLVTDAGEIVGFATSLDADTGGVEGATYVWSQAEVREVLGDAAPLFEAAYGVTEPGNWEGTTILARIRDDPALAADAGLAPEEVARRLAHARQVLATTRAGRPQPARDDKVLASWNGLALAALAEAATVMPGGEHFTSLASAVARSLHDRLRTPDGRIRRSWKDGRRGPAGVLEDHTHLAAGLLALYQATFEERWFDWAVELIEVARAHFGDPAGGFLDTADDATDLFARPRSLVDGAIPSGNAMAATVMADLHAYTGDGRWAAAVEPMLRTVAPMAAEHPSAFPGWLAAISRWSVPIDEVAIVGASDDPRTVALIRVSRERFRPWQVLAVAADTTASAIRLLRGRDGRTEPTAWVCHGGTCQMPVSDPDALRDQLGAVAT